MFDIHRYTVVIYSNSRYKVFTSFDSYSWTILHDPIEYLNHSGHSQQTTVAVKVSESVY